jgi:glycosyltransferase involved in cell wall biosynthesis
MVTYSPFAIEPRTRRTVEALISAGMSVDLVCLRNETAVHYEIPSDVEVFRIPLNHRRTGKLRYFYQYGIFILIATLIFAVRAFSRGYDLVYVHNMPDILVLCALVPKILGAKVVLDLHDPMPELMMTIFDAHPDSKSVRVLKRLEKWSVARANLVIAVNLACKRIFSSRSCSEEKLGVVMNSPDGEIFQFCAPVRTCALRPKEARFVVMYHGSIVERNGLDIAVEALENVLKTFPSAELRICGSHTPFLEHVMEVAHEKNVHHAIRYLGHKKVEDVALEIEKCDVGIIPNPRNAFTEINTPTRIFEYLALGKPVIAPCTQGIRDYFDGEAILFFEPGNSRELAQQIEYVFAHSAEVAKIVRTGQKIYLEHTWQQEQKALLNLVSDLLRPDDTSL